MNNRSIISKYSGGLISFLLADYFLSTPYPLKLSFFKTYHSFFSGWSMVIVVIMERMFGNMWQRTSKKIQGLSRPSKWRSRVPWK